MMKTQGWTFHHCGTIENVTGCIVTENELHFNQCTHTYQVEAYSIGLMPFHLN